MSTTQEPADESKDVNRDAEQPKEIINKKLEDKSPANIYLINKELNPMLGIPMRRNSALENASPEKKSQDIISVNKIMNEEKNEDKNQGKKIFHRGIVTRGFDFVKDGMKKNRKK
ncbi:MAG: hypothetical protein JST55_09730 [Bacteroidetes bacterium]|nr:hypothetical protein [Bacteroidota bacterium]